MSIYIKNLNKPVGDEVIVLMPDGAALSKGYPQPLETMEIIEVPPHGRLIDADALLKLIDSCMFPSDMVTTRAVSMATNWIKEAPTVIPADKDGET